MQFIRDLREVTGALKELVADEARHEEDDKLELAVSAQRFSQETREVVDDKLSFSATLMRAGEVEAANRLLAEVEAQVRDNEAALIEQVNEVKVARAARRERITRMRLARSLAVAMLGAAVMATSAAGMAFASFLEDRSRAAEAAAARRDRVAERTVAHAAGPARARAHRVARIEKVKVGGVEANLTPAALAAFEQLQSGDVDAAQIEHLLSLLPQDLAETMREVLSTAKIAEQTVKDAVPALTRPFKKKPPKDDAPADPPKEDQKPPDDPSPDPDPDPSPDPTPEDDPEDPDDTSGLPEVTSS
ncbi:MAG TPA: hypothetical protein VHI71_04310 [Actinomycetota bacterium]|nr:hypothetical protein [Actinomycetota bacterium]